MTNNQDMVGAKLTHRGMKSRLLPPGRFSYLERTTWELDKYVIRMTVERSSPHHDAFAVSSRFHKGGMIMGETDRFRGRGGSGTRISMWAS